MNLISVHERPDRAELLYALLKERDSTVNISHRGMPCWGDHIRFIESKPYEAWYFVMDGNDVAGACYLSKQNEIGIFIFEKHRGAKLGRQAVQKLMQLHGKRRYLANMNPRNDRSRLLFTGLGFKPVQHTYGCISGCS
jgi:RimJ/RimL family protein N-acetyltransferase